MSYHTGRELVELRNKNRITRRTLLKEGLEQEYKHFLSNSEQTTREAATQEMTMLVFESAKCQIVKFYAALDVHTKSEADKTKMRGIMATIDVKIKNLLDRQLHKMTRD